MITTTTPAERLRLYQSDHTIQRMPLAELAYGSKFYCTVDGIRIIPVKGGRFRHDPDEVLRLMEATYGGRWPGKERAVTERDRVEQAFIDGSVEGSPIDRDGNRLGDTQPFDYSPFSTEDQHGTPCRRAGHVPGCAGQSGGDHELLPGWISYDDGEGNLIEVEVTG